MLLPQSEYRPTEYLQQWVSFWFNDAHRLDAAKRFQSERIQQIRKHWLSSNINNDFNLNSEQLEVALRRFEDRMQTCATTGPSLFKRQRLPKLSIKSLAMPVSMDFTRSERGNSSDIANQFLDHIKVI